jgi:hypothetical protein
MNGSGAGTADTDGPDWDEASGRAEELRDDGYRSDEPRHGLDAFSDDDDDDDEGGDDPRDGGDGGPGTPGPAGTGGPSGGAKAPSEPSAPAANIHLLVPAGTVLGWSTTPGEVAGLSGPLDAEATRDLIRSAARNPATRWHVTLVDEESGEAVAHACARGRHSWDGITQGVQTVQTVPDGVPEQARPPGQRGKAELAEQATMISGLLGELGITEFEPIARGGCDHRHAEEHYTPSRKLGDLVRARTATCPGPTCGSSAVHNDLDHTVPWPDGATDECNLAPPCRRHHRVKQAPGWRLEQQESPGHMRWTTPSGRTYDTHPTRYDL